MKITNDLVTLRTASEHAAIYQGAGVLNQEQFQNGEMSIEDFAYTKQRENTAVNTYQSLQTQITTDILTLEILTHTPIITNTTTDVTLDEKVEKTQKELDKENKEFQKQLKKELQEDKKKLEELEKAEKKGIRLYGTNDYFTEGDSCFSHVTILLGYGGLALDAMEEGIRRLDLLLTEPDANALSVI